MVVEFGEEHLDQDGVIGGRGKGCVVEVTGGQSFWRSGFFKIYYKHIQATS